ncbi:MAG TPA: hypothetical protein DDW49_01210 [Deltaproteobacteria bacterium]|nr:hypothetical protein [Deltaproteobacteria bacterium]
MFCYLAMFPFIINHDPWVLPTFFFMVMVASVVATFFLYWQAPKKGFSQIAVLDISLFGTLGGIIGARLFHVFVEAPSYYWEDPIRVFYVWQGGFVGYGAFIGIMASTLLYVFVKKLPLLDYADFVATACPFIIFFVRVGCLGAGCCYGKPTHFWLHLSFTDPASDAGSDFPGVKLHATQLYDMANAAFIFFFLQWFYPRRKFKGQIFLLFLMMYAFFRFFIECLRGDADRGVYLDGLISTSQVTGIVIIAVCSIFYFVWQKKYKITAL